MGIDFRFVDLFCGVGGFRLALEDLGGECVFSSEIDTAARQTYARNFGDAPSGDITKIDASSIPEFDLLAAGFPCQPFSYAGKLEGFHDKVRGTLFFDVLRIIRHHRPKMFILENVKGLKSHNQGSTMQTIIDQLEHTGYTVHWSILDSLDFELPQQRQRWYCVGFREPRSFAFPSASKNKSVLRDIVDRKNTDPALLLPERELKSIDFHFKNCPADSKKQIRVKHDSSRYAPTSKKGRHGVFSYLKPDKTLRFHVGDYSKTQIQEAYYCTLDSYSPAIIKARSPKLWDLRRRLSVLECQRLQGFPDAFKFESRARQQLGNSVSVPVVRAIVENMIKESDHEE